MSIESEKKSTSLYGSKALGGFFILGVLLGPLGSLFIDWGYHLDGDGRAVGLHFLAIAAGYGIAAASARRIRSKPGGLILLSCLAAAFSLIALSFLAPPVAIVWRLLTLAGLGLAAGTLLSALPRSQPQSNMYRAATLFGMGCAVANIIVAVCFRFSNGHIGPVILAAVPLFGAVLYLPKRSRHTANAQPLHTSSPHDVRKTATILFGLLLFVQVANEWAIAGWLGLFLAERLGGNPQSAMFALAFYFAALAGGRWLGRGLISSGKNARVLVISTVAALSAYSVLGATANRFTAWSAIGIIGLALGPIFPLTAADPGEHLFAWTLDNRLFSFVLAGALAVPWLLGYVDSYFGMRYVLLLPGLGSILALVLSFLVALEARVMGRGADGGGMLL